MEDRRVRGVDAAFERLEPVAFLPYFRDVAMALRYLSPLERGGRRHQFARSQIGPDHPAHLGSRISRQVDLVAELLGLVHLIDAIAVDIELPAVINAAQTRLFVASEPQRGASVRTELVDQTDPALAVAKTDQTFAQKLNANRPAIGFRKLARKQRWDPISPQHVTHRGPRSGPRHQFVVFARQHYSTSSSSNGRRRKSCTLAGLRSSTDRTRAARSE